MLCCGCCFYLLLTSLLACRLLLIFVAHCCVGKRQALYLGMSNINLANLAADHRESCLNGICRYTYLTCPDIGCAAWNEADDAVLPLSVHHSVDDLVQRSITTICNHHVITFLSSFSCQFHAMPAILFYADSSVPTCCG